MYKIDNKIRTEKEAHTPNHFWNTQKPITIFTTISTRHFSSLPNQLQK